MCGIAGFVGAGDGAVLDRMLETIAHRGPDGLGTSVDPTTRVYLGHRRLSVLDLDSGAQPMWTHDGSLGVVYNGEIYNHAELRQKLEGLGHTFRTDHSDTEVLLHGFRAWGERVVDELHGMWAFALFDRAGKRLFLSRDRFGQKPLHYAWGHGTFVFASEVRAVLRHPSVSSALSKPNVQKYFAHGYVPAPRTVYQDVHQLQAGHNLVLSIDGSAPRPRRYWQFSIEPETSRRLDDLSEELRATVDEAVERHLRCDVPVGVLASGGLDSSIVAGCAMRHAPRGLFAFSIGFDDPTYDETAWQKQVAANLGLDLTSRVVTREEALRRAPDIVAHLDAPLGDGSLVPTSLAYELAKDKAKVVLGGDGADELFAGYDPFRALGGAALVSRLFPKPVHRAVGHLLSRLPAGHDYMSTRFRLARTVRGLGYPSRLWNPVWLAPLGPRELEDVFGGPVDPEALYSEAIEAWDGGAERDLVDRTTSFFVRLYLQDQILTKIDRASMMHSVEARSPFLDHHVVELARRLPSRLRLKGHQTKFLLRHAFRREVPPSILDRKKHGFALPVARWFASGHLRLEGALPFADPAKVEAIVARHRAGKEDARLFLWSAWALQRTT